MDIKINYGKKVLPFEIPDERISWIVSPNHVPPCQYEDDEIRKAIKNPIGMKPIGEVVKERGRRTVILVDDITRATPHKKILPVLLQELNDAGVKNSDIKIIIALGTHRGMTIEECNDYLGSEIVSKIQIINHDAYNPNDLVDIGTTPSGVPISINRYYYESDISIAVGNIIPHIYAGWSGGAKMIQPGVSGPVTTARTHLIATKYLDEILGNADNVIRMEMEDIAIKTGLTMIVNAVMNSDGSLVKVVAGDVVKAHRAGVEWAKMVYSSSVDVKPDIVIVSAYPGYIDLWQSTKAMTAGTTFVKPGGTVILLTPAPEGIPKTHPELLELCDKSSSEVMEMVESGQIKDEVAASVHITMSKCREKAEVLIVSEEQNKEIIKKLGFKFFDNINSALDHSHIKHGNSALIGISTHGADLAP